MFRKQLAVEIKFQPISHIQYSSIKAVARKPVGPPGHGAAGPALALGAHPAEVLAVLRVVHLGVGAGAQAGVSLPELLNIGGW